MTDDACPTCGPICGMREFGWEVGDGYALRMHDERDGIGAGPDEWLETPVRVERPTEEDE